MSALNKTNTLAKYTIISIDDSTQATFIPARGGIGSSIIMPGRSGPRELLSPPDFTQAGFTGGWPFCFPVCGRLERYGQEGKYYYDGHVYTLPIHGFAGYQPWRVDTVARNRLKISLRDTAETLTQYPFPFQLTLDYTVNRSELLCLQTYTNRGHRPMPYYAGFHPYFLTPPLHEGKENVQLNYQAVKGFTYNSALTDLTGEQPPYPLPTAITADINERLTLLGEDKRLTLTFADGDILQMIVEGVEDSHMFPYLQVYTPKEKSFICLEPWMSHPNAMNTVNGVRWLAPGQHEQGLLRLQCQ